MELTTGFIKHRTFRAARAYPRKWTPPQMLPTTSFLGRRTTHECDCPTDHRHWKRESCDYL